MNSTTLSFMRGTRTGSALPTCMLIERPSQKEEKLKCLPRTVCLVSALPTCMVMRYNNPVQGRTETAVTGGKKIKQ